MEQQLPPRPDTPQPFLEALQQEIERLIDRLRFTPSVHDMSLRLGVSGQMVPAIDLAERGDMIEVTAEVPGVSREDITITIEGDQLVLQGQKRDARAESEADFRVAERSYGQFRRRIPLGFVPEDNAVRAVFDNGVLRLTIHKPQSARTAVRKVEITSA